MILVFLPILFYYLQIFQIFQPSRRICVNFRQISFFVRIELNRFSSMFLKQRIRNSNKVPYDVTCQNFCPISSIHLSIRSKKVEFETFSIVRVRNIVHFRFEKKFTPTVRDRYPYIEISPKTLPKFLFFLRNFPDSADNKDGRNSSTNTSVYNIVHLISRVI